MNDFTEGEEFEEWKAWVDSHKNEKGEIDLGKHPEFAQYLIQMFKPKINFATEWPSNTGERINFSTTPRIIKDE